MDILDDLGKAKLRQETVITIGAFDGVHRGHQVLIRSVVDRARAIDCLAAIITFHPHPAMVLAPERVPRYLTTPGEKMALFEALGVDMAVLLPFTRELAALPARDFMAAVRTYLRLRELQLGPDFSLGRNREGNIDRLQELGHELGYQVRVVSAVDSTVGIISSSRIRQLLAEGRVDVAAELLGRYPSLSGEVVAGARRGRNLGFPTANLEVRAERAVPANGVYAVFAVLGSERYAGVANVGVRPSFDNGERTVETHILDFDQDIYGCDLVVEFVARLRDERRFADIAELVAQIDRDSQAAREILSGKQQTPPAAGRQAKGASLAEGEEQQASGGQNGGDEEQLPSLAGCRYRYYEVEHTADRALHVWGQTLPDLFEGAARGMASLTADLTNLVAVDWREIHLEGWDRESLLVAWLNELLYLAESEGQIFFEARLESLTATSLRGQVGGVRVPVAQGSVKAATYHALEVVPADRGGWSTMITFDA